jgi:hypothetical protein
MTVQPRGPWHKSAGIDRSLYPSLFLSPADVTPAVPQAHVIRRAFDLLKLDGIFCTDGAPIAFFKLVKSFALDEVLPIHQRFWNHGGAPVLVLISRDRAEIYSGLSRPIRREDVGAVPPSLIAKLDNLITAIPGFLLAVESGAFFREYARSFDASRRVDRDLLSNLGDVRTKLSDGAPDAIPIDVLDALLCRLVFTCYLFDRGVVGHRYLEELGLGSAVHLRDVLSQRPLAKAKAGLFKIFRKLSQDFNGDLFCENIESEARLISNHHIGILDDFFQGTQVSTGQRSFWPYDFQYIPIETISAIYEHFLKAEDQEDGAFYTPRFLAEIVLDSALEGMGSLLGKRFLDPACGSGIFLVGLFNRIAEEWKVANPGARNDRRARELSGILQQNLFGVDINRTACRIAAFSLYLAYLDQLSPRDIQTLQEKGRALPRLIAEPLPSGAREKANEPQTIRCADFFDDQDFPHDVDLIVGNPPWGSTAGSKTQAGLWCARAGKPLPDSQIAAAFVWKAVDHVSDRGRISLVLPHGVLFNHSPTAVRFQRKWVEEHSIERVLNLADLRLFLFSEAIHPALVVNYKTARGNPQRDTIEYLTPKADWTITQAEVIVIGAIDRRSIRLNKLLLDLDGPDAPQLWSQNFWGSPRDLRFIDRMMLQPRLRDLVRLSSEETSVKRWVRAEGFQPAGKNDDLNRAKRLKLPSRRFIKATHPSIDLFVLAEDAIDLPDDKVLVRNRSNTDTNIFRAPHVLITKGFQRIAYADFDVSFQHAVRGIHGPPEDRSLLIFLAAYLRTPLAKYLMFHTSSNWGIYRPEVHVQEVLRLPMLVPDGHEDPAYARVIISEVARVVDEATRTASANYLMRANVVTNATQTIEPLVYKYFGVQPSERLLIDDTLNVIIPSVQPTRSRAFVPTMTPVADEGLATYKDRLCETLSQWSRATNNLAGRVARSRKLGIAMAVIERTDRPATAVVPHGVDDMDLLAVLDTLQKALPGTRRTIDFVRGLMIFHGTNLYIVKPDSWRHWTQSSALNDADEIAGRLLAHPDEVRS